MSTSHDALSTGLWVRVDSEQLVSLLPAVETVDKGGWCRAVGCRRWVTGFLDRTGVGVGSVAVRLGRWGGEEGGCVPQSGRGTVEETESKQGGGHSLE